MPAAGYARQHTIKNDIGCSGTGLHSGAPVVMTLRPAPADSGVVFRRVDAAGRGAEIPGHIDYVVDGRLCTTIGSPDGVTVATVEHLMAALRGCNVDNVVVEVDGPELPVMDGSAAPFVFLIECAGLAVQEAPRRAIEVLAHVRVDDGARQASLTPGSGTTLNVEIDFDSAAIGRQSILIGLINGTFKAELCRARTFGFADEVDRLRAAGFARGGSLDNAVVVNGSAILNDGGLRYDDEFARHKALDSIGDMYLVGAPIIGHFYGYRPGHALNHELLRTLFADRAAWRYTTGLAELALDPFEGDPEMPAAAIA